MREEKIDHCKGKTSVLIDDLPSNIKDWESHGGTGILFKNAGETRNRLEELGSCRAPQGRARDYK